MTITELKYIIAVAQERHFGRAAERVFVSQPTLSIGIKKLEEELGVAIFERLSNKVVPTNVGERIIEAAQDILMTADTIKSIASEAKGELSGNINLGAIYTICPYLLPKIIPDLHIHAPNLRLFIKEDYTHNLIERLKSGELDMAIVSLPLPSSPVIEFKEITEEPFYAVLPHKHPLTEKKSITTGDLNSENLFLLGGGNCFRDQVLQACPTCISSTAESSNALEGGSLETIRMMVSSGLGISVFPEMALTKDNTLTVRPFTQPSPKRHIAIAWRKSFIQKNIIDTIEASMIRCQEKNRK